MRKTSENSTQRDTSYSSMELLHGTLHAKAVERERKPIRSNDMLKRIFRKL